MGTYYKNTDVYWKDEKVWVCIIRFKITSNLFSCYDFQAGLVTGISFFIRAGLQMFGGAATDAMIKRGMSKTNVRKIAVFVSTYGYQIQLFKSFSTISRDEIFIFHSRRCNNLRSFSFECCIRRKKCFLVVDLIGGVFFNIFVHLQRYHSRCYRYVSEFLRYSS